MISSSLNSIEDYARKLGSEVHYKEIPYPPTPPNNITYHRRYLYFNDGSTFFVCYADSKELGPQGVYSGVLKNLDIPLSFNAEFRKRDILDKLNIFPSKKTCKSGIPSFDFKVRIKTTDKALLKRLLQERNMQNLILDGLNSGDAMLVGINMLNAGFIPELKGRSLIGIYTQMTWIEDRNMIERLFKIMD
jgi:hypothetical protein